MTLPGCNGRHDNHAEVVCSPRTTMVQACCVWSLQEEDRLTGTHPSLPPILGSSLGNKKPCVHMC